MKSSKVFLKFNEVVTSGNNVLLVRASAADELTTNNLKKWIINNVAKYTTVRLSVNGTKNKITTKVVLKKDAGEPEIVINVKNKFKTFDELNRFENDFNSWRLENCYC